MKWLESNPEAKYCSFRHFLDSSYLIGRKQEKCVDDLQTQEKMYMCHSLVLTNIVQSALSIACSVTKHFTSRVGDLENKY